MTDALTTPRFNHQSDAQFVDAKLKHNGTSTISHAIIYFIRKY